MISQQFFGKYRGKVESNVDPLRLGRLQVSAPAVLGEGRLSWAMPCVPYAGPGVGLYAIPPLQANVWVEFEGGDPDYPIWSGCFWGEGQLPAGAGVAETKVLKTDAVALTLSELPGGGVTLEAGPPATPLPLTLRFDSQGIRLTAAPASLALTSSSVELRLGGMSLVLNPASVSINDGALEVT